MSYNDTFDANFAKAQTEYDNQTDDRYDGFQYTDAELADMEADEYDTLHGDDDGEPDDYNTEDDFDYFDDFD